MPVFRGDEIAINVWNLSVWIKLLIRKLCEFIWFIAVKDSHPETFFNKVFWKEFAKFTGKHLCRILQSVRVTWNRSNHQRCSVKRDLKFSQENTGVGNTKHRFAGKHQHRFLPVNFVNFLNTLFVKHLRTATSVYYG